MRSSPASFRYRFGSGDGLNGHALGNLVLAALADVMNDFPRAVQIAARVVGARGRVLPATSELVTLVAEFEDGRVMSGETSIASCRRPHSAHFADSGAPAVATPRRAT